MIAPLLLLMAATVWTVAFHGVPGRALPLLAVVVLAAAACQRWRHPQAGLVRDLVTLVGGGLAVVLVPSALPLAVALTAVVLGQPTATGALLTMAAASAFYLGHGDGRVPGRGGVAALAVVLLMALAVEAWEVTDRRSRRPGGRNGAWLRWVAGPVVVACVVGLAVGLPLAERAVAEQPIRRLDWRDPPRTATGLAATLTIGSQRDLLTDPLILARLETTSSLPPGPVYLRAQALPVVELVESRLRWRSREGSTVSWSAGPAPETPDRLWRQAGGGDAVWRPDGSTWCSLDLLQRDEDGNVYRPGLGRGDQHYAVGRDEGLGEPVTDDARALALRYPADLSRLPWATIEDRAWGRWDPEAAAAAITAVLGARCTYALTGLPEPAPGVGGALQQFLFAPEAALRRGHCQYFASAATLLLRRAGHPARVVIGFASDERDSRGVTFRALHAHAWVEVADRTQRWRRWDPTPAAVRRATTTAQVAAVAAAAPLPLPPLPPLPPPPRPPMTPPPAVHAGDPVPPPVASQVTAGSWVWWVFAVTLAVALVGGWWGWRSSPTRLGRRPLAPEDEALIALARELGLRVTRRTTLTDLAQGLTRRTGIDLGPDLQRHLEARYGHGPAAPPWPVAQLRKAAASTTGTPGA